MWSRMSIFLTAGQLAQSIPLSPCVSWRGPCVNSVLDLYYMVSYVTNSNPKRLRFSGNLPHGGMSEDPALAYRGIVPHGAHIRYTPV